MIVTKFGGTSVGSAEAIYQVKEIISKEPRSKIVVCSAMSGVTDQLIELSNYVKRYDTLMADRKIAELKYKHDALIDEIILHPTINQSAKQKVADIFDALSALLTMEYKNEFYSFIITSGELLLTCIFSEYLKSQNVQNVFLKASDFMLIDSPTHPNTEKVGEHLSKCLDAFPEDRLFITQGFVYKKPNGKVGHLTRGGSDYSAVIMGAAINAAEVQIWTDVNGLLNNDPRYVEDTHTVENIAYEEVAQLAYFGAKILHPKTTYPLLDKAIPILLKNTFNHMGKGTLVSNEHTEGIKGVAAKDGMNLITIEARTQKETHDYIKEVSTIFNKYRVNTDITNISRNSILVAVKNNPYLNEIIAELSTFSVVQIERNQTVVSIVGNSILTNQKALKVFNKFSCMDIKMIEYGASKNSIAILVDEHNKVKILKIINEMIFKNKLSEQYVQTA